MPDPRIDVIGDGLRGRSIAQVHQPGAALAGVAPGRTAASRTPVWPEGQGHWGGPAAARRRDDYPLSPENVIPAMIWRWKTMNATSGGRLAIASAAMIRFSDSDSLRR